MRRSKVEVRDPFLEWMIDERLSARSRKAKERARTKARKLLRKLKHGETSRELVG